MEGADRFGVTGDPRLDHTYSEITTILAGYNGSTDDGVEVYGVDDVFESDDAAQRRGARGTLME
ncbi:MAG TPA: hypothetical protein VGC67_11235 [Cellulomonas sp.]